ncbi:MAG: class I SAM-dependent methyltransferase [Actinomycetota bacterium]|nr:class I SAM-dependent methyltransferase [Actinomycetota bacterium]
MSKPAIDSWHEENLHAWHILSPLLNQGGYLPWTTGSMRPAGMVAVCNEIVHGARTQIVECGSGVSTVLLARLLRERQAGRLVALEHDRHWAALVQDHLRRETLDTIASVLHAPLQGDPPWYELAALDEVPDEVDLLIVDGPPASDPGHGTHRAPALPRFAQRLVIGATVILDDINRRGECDVMARWEASTDWRFVVDEAAGVAVGRRDEDVLRQ